MYVRVSVGVTGGVSVVYGDGVGMYDGGSGVCGVVGCGVCVVVGDDDVAVCYMYVGSGVDVGIASAIIGDGGDGGYVVDAGVVLCMSC